MGWLGGGGTGGALSGMGPADVEGCLGVSTLGGGATVSFLTAVAPPAVCERNGSVERS